MTVGAAQIRRGPLIALTGPIGSGKDTLALALTKAVQGSVRVKFADKLYQMAKAFDSAFDPDMDHVLKDQWVLDDPALGTRRRFLQQLGTGFARDLIHQDIWIKSTEDKINRIWQADPRTLVVISDARSTSTGNEEAMIRRYGKLVHLRPDWCKGYTGNEHSTERGIPVGPDDLVLHLQAGRIQEGVDALLEVLVALIDG